MKPTYVTFEKYESYCDLNILQFIYDKGFRFKLETEGHRVTNNLAEQRFNEGDIRYCDNYITYSVVIEWLRVNHGIWIEVRRTSHFNEIRYQSYINEKYLSGDMGGYVSHTTPQEAYSAAFNHILNNKLI